MRDRRAMLRDAGANPHQTMCHRCDEQIVDYHSAIKQRGRWIHRHCASGGDDQ